VYTRTFSFLGSKTDILKLMEEVLKIIKHRPKERIKAMRSLSTGEQSAVFTELSPHVQQALLADLKDGEIVDMVDHLDPRRAEKVLTRIKDEGRRKHIIKKLKSEAKDKIEYFLRFHPKATTALINFNYVLLSSRATVGDAAEAAEEHFEDTGRFPELLLHERGRLIGEVPLSVLVRQRNSALIRRFVQPVETITYRAEVPEIVNKLINSQKKKVMVLDYDESVLGLIYADDALSLFGKLPAETLYNMSGLDESEQPFDSAFNKFNHRYRWLVVNLATCFMAGGVIYLFEDTVDRLVVLSMYIPIVAGMGSNAGSQTFAVMLRGIILGTINLRNSWPAIKREVIAGLYNGLLIGALVSIISLLWNQSLMLGVVVGLSMIGVHIVAGFFGALLPLFLKHLGKDPASITNIFITTATDIFGLFLLLGLGTWLLL